jgi:F-type H+/Na+-transporting ATPase subunit beta
MTSLLTNARDQRTHPESTEKEMKQTKTTDGRVIAVRGAVLDIAFEAARLPPIDDAMIVTPDRGAPIMAEVQSQLDEMTVRAIALRSTAGLRRPATVQAAGGPLQVPGKLTTFLRRR